MSFTLASNASLGTFRNREATMVRSLMNTPAELTPTASTRGMCSAADLKAATMPS